ncbi:hypothetical protein ANN_27166 [Periplaneta americana]|uniref:Uncharacterized protein n=1 Tax=Periplaneta americana TaxID=6978 RepID=A0ABQ8RXH8_PERAM|nr:hypothetical protein ANN_27166 [Periplaneta americana]
MAGLCEGGNEPAGSLKSFVRTESGPHGKKVPPLPLTSHDEPKKTFIHLQSPVQGLIRSIYSEGHEDDDDDHHHHHHRRRRSRRHPPSLPPPPPNPPQHHYHHHHVIIIINQLLQVIDTLIVLSPGFT